jgi:hypothetical protein
MKHVYRLKLGDLFPLCLAPEIGIPSDEGEDCDRCKILEAGLDAKVLEVKGMIDANYCPDPSFCILPSKII